LIEIAEMDGDIIPDDTQIINVTDGKYLIFFRDFRDIGFRRI
jgi:hypothetical protein